MLIRIQWIFRIGPIVPAYEKLNGVIPVFP